jgi:hypothetical protein
MKKISIIAAGTVFSSMIILVLWGIWGGGAGAQDFESYGTEPYEEEPTTSGGSGVLSLGEYTTMDEYKVPCVVGQSYSPFDNSYPIETINKVVVGNAWGRVTGAGSFSAWADAYDDSASGDCGNGDYAGGAFNDAVLELYVEPVFAMDSTSSDEAYFRFHLTDIKEYSTTDCTGSYSTLSESYAWTNTHSNDMGDDDDDVVTTWKQCEFDTGYSNSSCLIPHRGVSHAGYTGYKSYSYTVKAQVCSVNSWPCAAEYLTEDTDTGCFYVNWVNH